MAKKEVKTDIWVYEMLKEASISLTPQGSEIKEISSALKTASKSQTGKNGFPEYCGTVKNFVIVIEDKAFVEKHLKRDMNGLISQDKNSVRDYAVNGALFYGKHIAKNTGYKKILVFGVSGDAKRHKISPIFVNERCDYFELPDVETEAIFSLLKIERESAFQ